MANYKGNDRQDLMIPVCLSEQLIPGTIEHAIDWIIDHEVETAGFDAAHSNEDTGRPAYDPKALLKVILYAYSKGILSSRKIEAACRTNIVFMALCGDVHPDHTTIARFITAHSQAISMVFRDVLLIAAQGDLIGAEVFALDGCKIPSNAAKEHSGTHRELERKIGKLEFRLAKMLEDHRGQDDDDDQPPNSPPGAGHYQAQIDRARQFLAHHDPRIGARGKEVKSNITDNESAKLKSGSGFIQGYNALAMVDAKHQIIVAAEPVGQINEAPLLPQMVRQAMSNLRTAGIPDAHQASFLADTNYFTEENARFFFESGINGYVPDPQFRNRDVRFEQRNRARRAAHQRFNRQDFIYDEATDTYDCPAGKRLRLHTRATVAGRPGRYYRAQKDDCSACELSSRCLKKNGMRRYLFVSEQPASGYTQQMREKIDTSAGRRMNSQRMGIVEPVFANITATKGMRRFTLRGRAKVRVQWLYFALVHNIEKIATTGLIHCLAAT